MRILALTPQLPFPPIQGTTLRNFYLLRELAQRHEISLLSFLQPGDVPAEDTPLHHFLRAIRTVPAPARRSLTQRAVSMLSTLLPDMALRLASNAFETTLTSWLAEESFDVVQVEGIEMARYGLMLHESGSKARLVFDDHNAEYVLQRSAFQADAQLPGRWHAALYSLVQWQKLARYERRVIETYDAVAAVSVTDGRALQQIAPSREIFIVPNGVDTIEFAPVSRTHIAGEGFDLVFTGKMDYRPNIDAALWFGNEILPIIRTDMPRVRFVVVGQQPDARLALLGKRSDVVLTGRVEDVKPYIARAAVYVAPLRMGGGTRLKVLQAMSMGVPIVSTTLGCDGLDVEDGRELLIADTPHDFSAAVIRLIRDTSLSKSLGEAARQLAIAEYDWRHIGPRMEEAYLKDGGRPTTDDG